MLFFVPPGNPANVIEEVVMHPFAFSTTGSPVGVDEPEKLDDEALATELMTYAQNSESKQPTAVIMAAVNIRVRMGLRRISAKSTINATKAATTMRISGTSRIKRSA